MSGGGWMFLWLMVALKVPICALLYLVWWATREPEAADDGAADWKKPRVPPDHPRPRRPGPKRRGPHGDPLPRPPARVRALRGRTLRKATHRQ
jgi:hypothetical protein